MTRRFTQQHNENSEKKKESIHKKQKKEIQWAERNRKLVEKKKIPILCRVTDNVTEFFENSATGIHKGLQRLRTRRHFVKQIFLVFFRSAAKFSLFAFVTLVRHR